MPRRKLLVLDPAEADMLAGILKQLDYEIAAPKPSTAKVTALRLKYEAIKFRDEQQANTSLSDATTKIAEQVGIIASLQTQLKALQERLGALESTHKSQLASAEGRKTEAMRHAVELDKRVKELEPLANRWTASQKVNADRLAALAKEESRQRELATVRQGLLLYDNELAQPSGSWRRLQLTGDAKEQYLAKEAALRHRLIELTETEEERVKRLKKEAEEQRARKEAMKMNYATLGDDKRLERDHSYDRADQQPRYTRDQTFREPKPKLPNHIYGFEKVPEGWEKYYS